jgi:hypothetical protein
VRRPAEGEREVLAEGVLDLDEGLVGDRWSAHRSSKTSDGSPNRETQVTLMSARVVDLVAAGDRERWALAGDQIYVDFDISEANLPAGTRLSLGSAVLEVSLEPHTGCVKFANRFGNDAHRFVNTKPFRHLRLRGLNAKVSSPARSRRATRSASSDAPGRSPPAASTSRRSARVAMGDLRELLEGLRLRATCARTCRAATSCSASRLPPRQLEASSSSSSRPVSGSTSRWLVRTRRSWPTLSAATRSGRWQRTRRATLVSFLSKRLSAKVARELDAAEIAPAQLVIDGGSSTPGIPTVVQRAPLAKLLDDQRLASSPRRATGTRSRSCSSCSTTRVAAMRSRRMITVVGCHAGGEIGNVVVGGVPPPPGATVFEQMQALERDGRRRCGSCCCASRAAASPATRTSSCPRLGPTATPASSSWSRPSIRPCPARTRSARPPSCSRRAWSR